MKIFLLFTSIEKPASSDFVFYKTIPATIEPVPESGVTATFVCGWGAKRECCQLRALPHTRRAIASFDYLIKINQNADVESEKNKKNEDLTLSTCHRVG
jgi:hypothetical protein